MSTAFLIKIYSFHEIYFLFRIGELSSIPGEDKIRMYAHMYDQWKQNKILTLSQIKKNDQLNGAIGTSFV